MNFYKKADLFKTILTNQTLFTKKPVDGRKYRGFNMFLSSIKSKNSIL